MTEIQCPVCHASDFSTFFHWENAVAEQQFLQKTQFDAQHCRRGKIELGFCRECGMIWNTVFDPSLLNYAAPYDATQTLSTTFQKYATDTAQHLVDKYDIRGKDVIEIGCGDARFLKLLCELGGNHGIGFDPSWNNENNNELPETIKVIPDYYSDRHADYHADLICSRHMLEHIHNPIQFLQDLAHTTQKQRPLFFFEVPNASWSLRNFAFWDIYYEHCTYFSSVSLNRLFMSCRFDVLDIREGFDGQYLWVESKLNSPEKQNPYRLNTNWEINNLSREVGAFSQAQRRLFEALQRKISTLLKDKKVVIWGAGARAVALLNLLKIQPNEIEYVVDINPKKWGAFVPGTGQEIVGPHFLLQYRPNTILVMNPQYIHEIDRIVTNTGISGKTQVIQADLGETHDRPD